MTAENTNILEGTLQGSLILEDFTFYRTDFDKLRFHYLFPCRSIPHIPPETEVLPHENPKIGDTNFSVEVLLIFV